MYVVLVCGHAGGLQVLEAPGTYCVCVSDLHSELLIPSPGLTRQIATVANVGLCRWHMTDGEEMNEAAHVLTCAWVCTRTCVCV